MLSNNPALNNVVTAALTTEATTVDRHYALTFIHKKLKKISSNLAQP